MENPLNHYPVIHGVRIRPSHLIKKKYHAWQIDSEYVVSKDTYKEICKGGERLERRLRKIKVMRIIGSLGIKTFELSLHGSISPEVFTPRHLCYV